MHKRPYIPHSSGALEAASSSLRRLQIARSDLSNSADAVSPLFSELLALEHLCLHTNSAHIVYPMDLPVGRLTEVEIDWKDCSSAMAHEFIQERAPSGGGYLRSLRIHRCSDRSPSQNWPKLAAMAQQLGVTFSLDN